MSPSSGARKRMISPASQRYRRTPSSGKTERMAQRGRIA
jgi:hypothetical protein